MSPRQLRQLVERVGDRRLTTFLQSPSPAGWTDGARPARTTIGGRVSAPDGFSGMAYVGLFQSPIPQSLPDACTVAPAPGSFFVDNVPRGVYHLLAMAFPASERVRCAVLTDACRHRIGVANEAVVVHESGHQSHHDIVLRPIRSIDPPLLPAVVLL